MAQPDDLKQKVETIYQQEGTHKFLEDKKSDGILGLQRSDFIWHYLLQSFSTMGRSNGFNGLIKNTTNYDKLNYETLKLIEESKRENYILEVLKDANVRWPRKKSVFINKCFQRIIELGGLEKTKELLFQATGKIGKIEFLSKFTGIGPKYARNIMMDAYHEEFKDSIAIDSRIKKIIEKYNLESESYDKAESNLLKLAKELGIEGWELDRLLYKFTKEFLKD